MLLFLLSQKRNCLCAIVRHILDQIRGIHSLSPFQLHIWSFTWVVLISQCWVILPDLGVRLLTFRVLILGVFSWFAFINKMGHKNLDWPWFEKHKAIYVITSFQNFGSCLESLRSHQVDYIVDDFVWNCLQIGYVPDHLSSHLHVLIVIFWHFGAQTQINLRILLLGQIHGVLVQSWQSALVNGLDTHGSLHSSEKGYFAKIVPLL